MTWKPLFNQESNKPYYESLMSKVDDAYKTCTVYPKKENLFRAFDLCSFESLKVLIIGQDPYHQKGQADGLAFSVANQTPPPSLRNIFKELKRDLGIDRKNTDLSDWATQGVLLLNTILSVEDSKPLSHKGYGWETFTDSVIRYINDHKDFMVIVLWGNQAKQKKQLITNPNFYIIKTSHPSPLGAYRGFLGSHCFSEINKALIDQGKTPIIF